MFSKQEKLLWIAIFVFGFIAGASFNSSLCEDEVLNNIAKHHKFEAELSKSVNPDFLTELKGK